MFDAAATPSSFDQEKDPGGDKSPRTPRTRTTSDASSTGQPSSPPSASSPTTPVEPVGAQAYGLHKADIVQFRQFLRSLLMHGAIGTAIGGSTTLVGEPQNLVRLCLSASESLSLPLSLSLSLLVCQTHPQGLTSFV